MRELMGELRQWKRESSQRVSELAARGSAIAYADAYGGASATSSSSSPPSQLPPPPHATVPNGRGTSTCHAARLSARCDRPCDMRIEHPGGGARGCGGHAGRECHTFKRPAGRLLAPRHQPPRRRRPRRRPRRRQPPAQQPESVPPRGRQRSRPRLRGAIGGRGVDGAARRAEPARAQRELESLKSSLSVYLGSGVVSRQTSRQPAAPSVSEQAAGRRRRAVIAGIGSRARCPVVFRWFLTQRSLFI